MDYEACGQKLYAYSIRFIHLTNAFKWIPSDKNHHDSLGSCHKVFFSFLATKLFPLFFFTLPHFQFTQTAQEIYQLIIYSSVQAIIFSTSPTSLPFLHCIKQTTTRSSFLLLYTSHKKNKFYEYSYNSLLASSSFNDNQIQQEKYLLYT